MNDIDIHTHMHHSVQGVYNKAVPLFFYNDTATTQIYTLSLHDALPISADPDFHRRRNRWQRTHGYRPRSRCPKGDRKSTRLNSSHSSISYAVFCLKKKKRATFGTTRILATNRSKALHAFVA